MAWNPQHGLKHSPVGNAAKAQLPFDHLLSQAGVDISIDRETHGRLPDSILFLALADAHVKAHDTVLVASTLYRKVAVEIVFALDDLL